MTDIITRIESADGPDRELFEVAFNATFPIPRLEDEPEWAGPGTLREPLYHAWYVRKERFDAMLDAGAWTSAAEILVPEGWVIGSLDWRPSRGNSGVTLLETGTFSNHMVGHDAEIHAQARSNAATPALALAAAALKARGV